MYEPGPGAYSVNYSAVESVRVNIYTLLTNL